MRALRVRHDQDGDERDGADGRSADARARRAAAVYVEGGAECEFDITYWSNSAQRGTTITLSGLFRPLPVRRKEFERTAKREFAKALGILTAYALVPASVGDGRKGVRLKVETLGAGRNP